MATERKRKPIRVNQRRRAPAPRRMLARRVKDTRRRKISTTIAPEGYAFLENLIESGKAGNLAEAMDLILDEMLRAENRARLERATAAYYEGANPEAIAEENELAAALSASLPDLLFDE